MPRLGQEIATPARRAAFVEHLRTLGDGPECAMWPWSTKRSGYTRIYVDGEKVSVHRWVYEQLNGPVAVDQVVMHTCDNPPCVRHLSAGTQQEMKPGKGGDFRRKLSDAEVDTILTLKANGVSQHVIARTFDVSDATISFIVRGRRGYARRPA